LSYLVNGWQIIRQLALSQDFNMQRFNPADGCLGQDSILGMIGGMMEEERVYLGGVFLV
jgi:hypothetical protein